MTDTYSTSIGELDHPARLLMQPQLKAQAWQILKPLKQLLAKAV